MSTADQIALVALVFSIGAFVVSFLAYRLAHRQDGEERRYRAFVVGLKKKYPPEQSDRYSPVEEVATNDEERLFLYRAVVDGFIFSSDTGRSVNMHRRPMGK